MDTILFASARSNWRTPLPLFRALDAEFHFTLDVAANSENHLCDRWIGPDHDDYGSRDCLAVPWGRGEVCFMNPPFSRDDGIDIAPFIEKADMESAENTVVALIPVRTDTRWWQRHVMRAAEIRFIAGRLRFTLPSGAPANSATFPSAIVVWSAEYRKPHITTWSL